MIANTSGSTRYAATNAIAVTAATAASTTVGRMARNLTASATSSAPPSAITIHQYTGLVVSATTVSP